MFKSFIEIPNHPCMNSKSHHRIARIHLPVAPLCNIRCGYCDRHKGASLNSQVQKPGVCERILTPEEAVDQAINFQKTWGKHSVIGIAGPGDPLANPETFDTLEKLNKALPDARLCLCTNGLRLPDSVDTLKGQGLDYVSVTINALDPLITARIHPWVKDNDQFYLGIEAASMLIDRQLEGVRKAVDSGIIVKINTVAIPEVNMDHIPQIAETVSDLGACVINVMPLIPQGMFSGHRAPDPSEMAGLYLRCNTHMNVFTQCKQCRADAHGLPGKERLS